MELKFRAWNRIVERMEMPFTLEQLYNVKGVQFQNLDFLQYTGLKDKNGIEIYKGDITKVDWHDKRYKPCICIVTWDDKNACFDFGAGATGEVCWSHEVIGNIYQNHKLLK